MQIIIKFKHKKLDKNNEKKLSILTHHRGSWNVFFCFSLFKISFSLLLFGYQIFQKDFLVTRTYGSHIFSGTLIDNDRIDDYDDHSVTVPAES